MQTSIGRRAEISEVAETDLPETAELMEDSGWDALIARASNPSRVLRVVDLGTGRVVTWTRVARPRWWARHGRGRVIDSGVYPWTAAEFDEMETDVNGYLVDAGADLRPRGYQWYIRDDVTERYQIAAQLQPSGHPAGYAETLLQAYRDCNL